MFAVFLKYSDTVLTAASSCVSVCMIRDSTDKSEQLSTVRFVCQALSRKMRNRLGVGGWENRESSF